MKIRELLYCSLDPREVPSTTSPVVAPVSTMPNGLSGNSQTVGPTTVAGTPSSQGGQTAQPGQGVVSTLPPALETAESIAHGPLGSQTGLPTDGFFTRTLNPHPMPLK